jgi:esterase
VHRWGEGNTACLFIHGFGDGAFVWSDLAGRLPRHFSAFAVDLSGHGYSSRSPTGEYFTHLHVADVRATLERLQLSRVILVGHSLGGEIAMRIAMAAPHCVQGLVIVDFGPETKRSIGRRVVHDLSVSMRRYSTADEYLEQLVRLRPLACRELLRHCANEALEGCTEEGFRLRIDPAIYSLAHIPSNNPKLGWEQLPHISCPTLILRGAGSSVLSRATAEKMTALIPQATLREIARSGHSIMLENPSAFRECVVSFLEQIAQAS